MQKQVQNRQESLQKAQADANKELNASITEELIRMKEAEARLKHGWVEVQGADAVVTEQKNK
jgi:hypothetical protein